MSNQIQTQAAKVWETIAAPETGATYQKTGALTWTIFRETGYLAWLVVCLVLVAGEWVWKTGYRTGYGFRNWLNNFERPSPDRLLSATGQTLLDVGMTGFAAVLSTARDQLGIEAVILEDDSAPALPAPPTPSIAPAELDEPEPTALSAPPTPPFTAPIAPTSVELDGPPESTDPLAPL